MPFTKKKLVCVDWEDASSNTGYYDKEKPDKVTTVNCKTVGYLLNKHKKVIRLGVEQFEDGDFRHIHCIPKGMVRKITYLTEAH